MKNNLRGFTLIELMITVAVLALIASVAIPAYTEQVARGRRAEAKSALLRAAQQMERFYSSNNCYPNNVVAAGAPCYAASNATALTAAGIANFSGDNLATSKYAISTTFNDGQTYTLTATLNAPFTDAKCGNLSLTNTGVKGETGTGTVNDCWPR